MLHRPPNAKTAAMAEFMSYARCDPIIAVAIVLVFGLVNMMRGGSPQTSQKLMRCACCCNSSPIIVIMLTIWRWGA